MIWSTNFMIGNYWCQLTKLEYCVAIFCAQYFLCWLTAYIQLPKVHNLSIWGSFIYLFRVICIFSIWYACMNVNHYFDLSCKSCLALVLFSVLYFLLKCMHFIQYTYCNCMPQMFFNVHYTGHITLIIK